MVLPVRAAHRMTKETGAITETGLNGPGAISSDPEAAYSKYPVTSIVQS